MKFQFSKNNPNSSIPSTLTRPSILIPSDILIHIFECSTQADLANFSLVSREYSRLAIPLLYRNISIDLSKDVNPLLVRRRRIFGLGKKIKRVITRKDIWDDDWSLTDWDERYKEEERDKVQGRRRSGKSKWSSRLKRSTLPINNSPTLKPSFEYTTHLTLSNHSQYKCRYYQSLYLPNLITLHIIPPRNKSSTDYAECHNFEDHDECQMDSTCVCPLIINLNPRRLIMGSEIPEYHNPVIDIPTYPTKWLEEIVIYASDYHIIQLGSSSKWIDGTYGRLKKVKIILQRAECNGIIDEVGVWREDEDGDVRRKPEWPLDMLYQRLGKVLEVNPGVMEVVGLEKTDWNWVGRPKLGDVEVGKKEMKKYLVENGWEEMDAEVKVDQVIFRDKAGYGGNG